MPILIFSPVQIIMRHPISATIICRIDQNPEYIETGISLKLEFPTQNQTNYVPRPEYLVKLRQDNFTANENQIRN